MPNEDLNITYHDTPADVQAAWASLCNGGYSLYVDGSGNLHALRVGAS